MTLESIGDAVISTDVEGKITFLNLVAERLTGWRVGEARGQPIDEVFKILDAATREGCDAIDGDGGPRSRIGRDICRGAAF